MFAFNDALTRALVLNASYEPIRVIHWQKAMLLWLQDKVDVLEFHSQEVHSQKSSFRLPSVMRLKTYIKPWISAPVKLSRDNIFIRDQHTCQYCAKSFAARDLTLDHVFPVSRGGKKSWENLVAACRKCNHRKGNKTPKEAHMPLLKTPTKPKWRPTIGRLIKTESLLSVWGEYVDT